MRTWVLRITSFAGTVPWAHHFMGRIERKFEGNHWSSDMPREPEFDVILRIDAEQAEALQVEEDVVAAINGYTPHQFKVGEETTRWEDRDALQAAALVLFEEKAEPGDILVGWHDYMTGDDNPPLARKEP